MYTEVVIVRSKTEEDAVVRLQSEAVVRGLGQVSGIPVRTLTAGIPGKSSPIANGACVLFHYDDLAASKTVKSLAALGDNLTFACFASDVYTFDPYLDVHDVVDFYLAPTRMHRLVLMSQLYKPVYLLPESIDPSAMDRGVCLSVFPSKHNRRLLWFGYPESFEKSMVSLVPVIKLHRQKGTIDSFTLISSTEKFENKSDLAILPYNKATFAQDAALFDYCILSHLPLDLALNSFIKSPNKLITSLFLGLIPIASRTPSYEDVLVEFGLERFLYESPADLSSKLKNLDPARDSDCIRRSGILDALKSKYSDASIATDFLRIATKVAEREKSLDLNLQPETLARKIPEVQTRDHLYDFLPSIRRAFQWRLSRR